MVDHEVKYLRSISHAGLDRTPGKGLCNNRVATQLQRLGWGKFKPQYHMVYLNVCLTVEVGKREPCQEKQPAVIMQFP